MQYNIPHLITFHKKSISRVLQDLRNKDNLKNQDDLKCKVDLKNEDSLKNEDNLKNEVSHLNELKEGLKKHGLAHSWDSLMGNSVLILILRVSL